MNINVTYDPSVSAAPAQFTSAVNYVVGLFDTLFTNNVTLNLQVGWGQVLGHTIDAGDIGESLSATAAYSTAAVTSALAAMYAQGDDTPYLSLPAADPTNGTVTLTTAEARAIGLTLPAVSLDGAVVLSATPGTFSFQPGAQSGLYSGIAALEHEITEVMGRAAGPGDGTSYTALDLYRYQQFDTYLGKTNDIFSLDKGTTALAVFNTDPTGDRGDWSSYGAPNGDPFLAFAATGGPPFMSQVDLQTMAALGWVDTPTPALTHIYESTQSAYPQILDIVLDFNTDISGLRNPNLTLSNGAKATLLISSGHTATFQYSAAAPFTTLPTPSALSGIILGADGLSSDLSLTGVPVSHYDNVLVGTVGGSTMDGGAHSAIFLMGEETESVLGGLGLNTAAFDGPLGRYVISQSGATLTVTDGLLDDRNIASVSILNNVQQLQFADVTLVLDLHTQQDLTVYQLYQAAYGRMPDNAGFRYWASTADTLQPTAAQLAAVFVAAPESTQLYGSSPTNQAYVAELYQNVLGRAPDQAGLDYWTAQANAGQDHTQLLLDFAGSPENVQLIAPHVSSGYWTT